MHIAALFANAGLRVKLYDVPAAQGEALPTEAAIKQLTQLEPSPLVGIEAASLIFARDYKQHLTELAEHDLVIEAYDLPLAAKQTWLTRLAPNFSRNALIVSLSAGESVEPLGSVLPAGMRPHFLGARFSVFPRWQRLVEVISTERSEERLVQHFMQFLHDDIGVKPHLSPDSPNFLFLRLWLFLLCAAFVHSQNLTAAQREAVTALIFAHQGGIYHFLQYIGIATSLAAYERLDLEEQRRFSPLLYWSAHLQQPLPRFRQRDLQRAVPQDVQQLWLRHDWLGLKKHPHPCADFICRYLRDVWQYLAYISEEQGLSGKELDSFLYDGIGWGFMPWQSLQAFGPGKVYETTLSEQAQLAYPVSAYWRRRPRSSKQLPQGDSFTAAAQLQRENDISRQYLYREELLIWQPQADVVDLDSPTLQDLLQAIAYARKEHLALMIYHQGSQMGVMRDWQQINNLAPLQQNIDDLHDCLMALRMHPRFVIFSNAGNLLDAGMALLLQADRSIMDIDLSWQLSSFTQGLTGLGGIWFEWLRRLPRLSSELARLQTATVLEKMLQGSGVYSLHSARDMGLLRNHDRYVMNRSQLPTISRKLADAWLDSGSQRAARYPLYKPSAQDQAWHLSRAEQSADPKRYRDLIALLCADEQQNVLSLRQFLHSESQLFFHYLQEIREDE